MMRLAKLVATVSSALVLALCFTTGAFAQTASVQQPVQKAAAKPAANSAAKPAAATQSAPNAPAKPLANTAAAKPAAKTATKPAVNTTAVKPVANSATKSAATATKPAVSQAMASATSKAAPVRPTAPGSTSLKTAIGAKTVAAKPVAAKPVAVKPVMAKPIATKAVKTPAAPKTASAAPKPAPKEAPAAPAVGMTASPDQAPSVSPDEPVGARRDPFVSLVNDKKESGGQLLPPGEAGLVVSTVRVDGTVKSGSDLIAVVSNPERHVYFIREGDHLYDGSVVRIDLDGVTFHEESKDAFGKPVVREVTKRIYATAGEQQ